MRFSGKDRARQLLFALALLTLFLLAVFFLRQERACELGRLPVLAARGEKTLTEAAEPPQLMLNGTPLEAAADGEYYIPQDLSTAEWSGLLQLPDDWELYTTEAARAAMRDRAGLIASGGQVELVAVKGSQKYTLPLVFTGMPVLSLTTESHEAGEERTLYYGTMTLYNTDGTAQTCRIRYNERGSYSLQYDKKGYKLNLMQADGSNLHLPLLGMRSDDDWQLRALYTDPQKAREITASTLWNQIAASSKQDEPTSRMDYLELIMDGDYRGLYLLAERLDDKTVEMADTDILYKNGLDTKVSGFTTAIQERQSAILREGHIGKVKIYGLSDAVTDPWTPYKTLMNLLYEDEGYTATREELNAVLDVDNAIDWGLFKQALGLYDNDLHNLYWLARATGEGYKMYYIPYDMDLSFGHFPDGLAEEPFGILDWAATKEFETPALTALLNADRETVAPRVNERWVELRQGVLSSENLFGLLDAASARVNGSGALARDGARWPGEYNDPDLTATKAWMEQRLAWLDGYYGPEGWSADGA